MKRRTTPLALALLLAALPALAADVTGKWTASFDTQIGKQTYTFDLKADGEKLTGKAAFERMGETGEADLLEGTVRGDEIAFTRKVGEFATEQCVATRVKN
jgi:hypothetical protein